MTDSATLSGGFQETGTITFDLYAPGGVVPVDTEIVTVSGNGTYTTPTGYTLPTTGTVTGTYQWVATYSGDGNNNGVASASGDEPVVVAPANLLISTTLDPSDVTLSDAPLPPIDGLGDAHGELPRDRDDHLRSVWAGRCDDPLHRYETCQRRWDVHHDVRPPGPPAAGVADRRDLQAWLNKGPAPENVAQARGFFDRSLAADPGNVDALVGSARADVFAYAGAAPMSAFADAEAKLTKALSSVPDHARAQQLLGLVYMFTKRAAEGIAECEHALELDRNLASTHFFLGLAKIFIGRAEETEAHVAEALRLSPRDPLAYMWMHAAGTAKSHLGSWEEAVAWCRRAIEANRNFPAAYFSLAAALAQLGRLDEARSAVRAGLALNPTYAISRARAAWTAWSDDPTYLAQLEPILEGMRKAGVPEE